MKRTILIIIAIAKIALVCKTSAQFINNNSLLHNRVYIRTGIEPATMITFGFQRNVVLLKKPLATYAEWKVSVPRFSFDNSELKIGGILPLLKKSSFLIANDLNLSAGSNETRNFISKKFAVADEIAIGFYKNVWFLATTAEYEKIYLNYIENTQFYKDTFYEDAKDGWYKGAGGAFQFGLESGFTIKKRYDIHLEIKMPFTEKFNGYGGSPLHANLEFGYNF